MPPPIPGRIFPIDPTLQSTDTRYRYGVVVQVVCGPNTNEVLIFVDSDDIITGREAIDRAIEDWTGSTNQGPYSPPPAPGDTGGCVFTGRVVSVGRRSDVPMFPSGR